MVEFSKSDSERWVGTRNFHRFLPEEIVRKEAAGEYTGTFREVLIEFLLTFKK